MPGAAWLASRRPSSRSISRAPAGSSTTPEEIWRSVVATAREAVATAGGAANVVAIGISNQRETSVVWERATGRPIHNAIVWQDRRTADACEELRAAGHEGTVTEQDRPAARPLFLGDEDRLDPRSRARRTRASRARRTCLRHRRLLSAVAADRRPRACHRRAPTRRAPACSISVPAQWDETLLRLFRVPRALLPEVRDNAAEFGETDAGAVRRRAADPRHGGRPAGGDDRPGVFFSRHAQVDLRHRLLCGAEHGR